MRKRQGFTLIELLIVIAIIAILAAVIFVALDPLKRFRDSRDAVRKEDVRNITDAIKIDQIDNGGYYHDNIEDLVAGRVYMINDGSAVNGCDNQNNYCLTDVPYDNYCVDLSFLETEGYLGELPISPPGETSWDEELTGYTLERDSNDIITVRACEAENTSEIWNTR